VVNLGYPIGSIQAPSGSELIALMRDAITGGGYATLGTVIMSDLDRIAQMRLPDVAYFVQVDLDVALAERKMMQQRLAQVVELGSA
jgi:urea carboxylase